eukprot:GHVS01028807.1.p1 GENE.GHVS01028807.1~~GHVS01028807.1.p1  ORF type:complete len:508 (-),score=102.35 GHVS01028807.1:1107-2630(-)
MSAVDYLPICGLTTYVNRWKLKARILDKSNKQNIRNGNQLFHVDIVDKQGDVIRGKFWGEAAQKWHSVLEKGKVYSFKGGRVVVANKKFSNIQHNYEINFVMDSEIEPVEDDCAIKAERTYNFCNLRDVQTSVREPPFIVDILGIIKSVGQTSTVTAKATNTELSRRTITVVDDSDYEMEITMWNQLAEGPEPPVNKVVAINDVTIKDWQGGRNGQSTSTTEMKFELDDEAAHNLQTWYTQGGKSKSFQSMKGTATDGGGRAKSTNIDTTIRKMREEVEKSDKPLDPDKVYVLRGCRVRRFMFARSKEGALRVCYPACPKCKKKLMSDDPTAYSCASCNQGTVHTPLHRYLSLVDICDHSNQFNIRCFHDSAAALIGVAAEELRALETSGESEKVDNILEHQSIFETFKLIAKPRRDAYNGEDRLQYIALKAEVQPYASQAADLLKRIREKFPNATEFTKSRKAKRPSDEPPNISQKAKLEPVIQEVAAEKGGDAPAEGVGGDEEMG